MTEKLFQWLGHRYVITLMILTRLFGSIGGMGVIYYVELTLSLPSPLREHFRLYSACVVVFSCTLTVLIAMWELRRVNRVIKRFNGGQSVDPAEAHQAGYDAATFVKRHHCLEAWLVPATTLVPYSMLWRV